MNRKFFLVIFWCLLYRNLFSSPDHIFFNERNEYIAAQNISSSSLLLDQEGKSIEVCDVVKKDTVSDVYDLITEKGGYAVGESALMTESCILRIIGENTNGVYTYPVLRVNYKALDKNLRAKFVKDLYEAKLAGSIDKLAIELNKARGMDAWLSLKNVSYLERTDPQNIKTVANWLDEVNKTPNQVIDEITQSGSYENWLADYFVTYEKNGYVLDKVSIDEGFKHVKNIQLNGVGKATYDLNSGLKGGHDKNIFNNELSSNGGRIEIQNPNSTSTNIQGVEIIDYKVLALDAQGNIIQGQYYANGTVFRKTIFDPVIYSDIQMKKIGYNGYKKAINDGTFDITDRSFIGLSGMFPVKGHYFETTKKISTWWINP